MPPVNQRAEALKTALHNAVAAGQLTEFTSDNPTGNKLVWSILDNGSGEVKEYDTPQAEAFVHGLHVGLHAPRRGGAARQPNPHREAIEASGEVTVQIAKADVDTATVKKTRNAIFLAAYGAGLKGSFKVTTTKNDDGSVTLHGVKS